MSRICSWVPLLATSSRLILSPRVCACVSFRPSVYFPLQAEGRPDAAGRGGPATLLSVGERWAAQLSGMEERAKAALHHCAEVPLVQANATGTSLSLRVGTFRFAEARRLTDPFLIAQHC